QGSGDRNGGSVTGSLDANAHRVLFDPLKVAIAAQTLTIESLRLRSPEAAGALNASGKVQLDAKPIGGEIALNWDGVDRAADLVGQALATQGTLSAHGNAQNFSAQADLNLGPRGKPAHLALELDGTPAQIALHRFELKQARGGFVAKGDIALQPQLGWKI